MGICNIHKTIPFIEIFNFFEKWQWTVKADASKNQIISKKILNLDDRVPVAVDMFSKKILIFSKIFLLQKKEKYD